MRRLFAYGVIAVAGLTFGACGGDDGDSPAVDAPKADAAIDAPVVVEIDAPTPDAEPDANTDLYDFTCETNAAPTTAPDPLVATGGTQEFTIGGLVAAGSVLVDVHASGSGTVASTTSNATTGAFQVSIPTGGTPFGGSLFGTKAGFMRSVVFPPEPLASAPPAIPLIIITKNNLDTLSFVTSVTQDSTMYGIAIVAVTDCANERISGSTIHAKQGGVDVGTLYANLEQVDPTNGKGVMIFYNLPPGEIEISGTSGTHTLRTHTIKSFKADVNTPDGTLSQTILNPGFPNP